jgi:beta-galactosidase
VVVEGHRRVGKRDRGKGRPAELKVGEKLFVPIEFPAPAVESERGDVTITSDVTIGEQKHNDAFSVHRLRAATEGRRHAGGVRPGRRHDEAAAVARVHRAAVDERPADRRLPPSSAAMRLSDRHLPPGDLAAYVSNGGRLIVFGQDNDWTRLSLMLRTAPHVARRAYAVDAKHPVLAGLTDDNLRDWNGEGTGPRGVPVLPGFEGLHSYGWHWGNRGSVTSTAIEKPHRSSFRPIIETSSTSPTRR